MKTKLLSYISALAMIFMAAGCHDPEQVTPNGDPKGILSLKASMIGDESSENSFDAEIDYDNNSIVVVFPYNYPRSSDELFTPEMMKDVKLTASLATNTKIEPALSTLDLSQTNYITVTNSLGERKRYSLKGEIRYSADCEMETLDLVSGISAVVYEDENRIMLVTPNIDERIEPQTASISLSYHATIIPDITKEPFDFEAEGAKIKVVAQDGKTSKEYTFSKGIPNRLRYGIRQGSARLMWLKKLSELGISANGGGDNSCTTTGLGITNDYVIINQQGQREAIVLNARTGEDTGKRLHMGNVPLGMNHNMTSDDAGNILVNTYYSTANVFTVWKFASIDEQGTQLYSASVYGAGNRISVIGDVNGNARFGTIANSSTVPLTIYSWGIENGKVNTYYDQFNLNGLGRTPWTSADFAPTSVTAGDNLFACYAAPTNSKYGPVFFSQVGNETTNYNNNNEIASIVRNFNAVSYGIPNCDPKDLKERPNDPENWIMNACDYKEFNNSKFFFYNSVNAQTFGGKKNDYMYLLDVTGGELTSEAVDFSENGLNLNHECGAQAAGNLGASGPCNDMRLWVDPTGFYMYAYFMYSNGFIGCVRVDCIQK
ncbi:MAG: DUF5018 domain-containing protein [Bacteroidales bacterium]|nr:DUF5018 domain-containing protein [Bacteroidales bacterium]